MTAPTRALEECFDELGRLVNRRNAPFPPEALVFDELSDTTKLCPQPLVSVCIISYNSAATIDEALEGVLAQDADFPFEVLISDDGSTDDTVARCETWLARYPDKVRILRGRRNVGLLGNRLRAFSAARAPWIAWLDSDDFWTDPGKLRKQMALLRETGAVMCLAFTEMRWADGRRGTMDCPSTRFVSPQILLRHYLHTSTYLHSREAFLRATRDCPNLQGWDDQDLLFGLAAQGRVALLPEVVSAYRITETGDAIGQGEDHFRLVVRWQFLRLFLYGPRRFRHCFLVVLLKGIRLQLTGGARPEITALLRDIAVLAHARAPWAIRVWREWRKLRRVLP